MPTLISYNVNGIRAALKKGWAEWARATNADVIALQLSLIHISEPTRQAEISYAVFCLKKKKKKDNTEDSML